MDVVGDSNIRKAERAQKHRGWERPLEVCDPTSCSEQPQLDLVAWDLVQSRLDTLKDGDSAASLGTCSMSEHPYGDNLFLLSS